MHHHHGHHHHPEPSDINRAFLLAVSLNSLFVILEVVYAFHAQSMSLLADAGHNLGDVLGIAMAWVANLLLHRKSGPRYSYGFKKTTILAALCNAILLILGCVVISYESIQRLLHPVEVKEQIVMIVAAAGIVINGGTALLFVKGQHDLNIKATFIHLASDALISLGVVLAGFIILWQGWDWIDPLLGLAIVITILWATWGLLRDSVNMILDAVPHHIDSKAVESYLKSLPGVVDLHDLHIWGLSTQEVALTAHLTMPNEKLSDEDFRTIGEKLKHDYHIAHATLQVESGNQEHPCKHMDCSR